MKSQKQARKKGEIIRDIIFHTNGEEKMQKIITKNLYIGSE
jgi:predicted transcriptional regulator